MGRVEAPLEQIKRVLNCFIPSEKRPMAELAFYGGDFLKVAGESRRELLAFVKQSKKVKNISGFRCSVRPDSIDAKAACWLFENGFTTVEIGAQCFNDKVLDSVSRKHTSKEIEKSAKLIRDFKMTLGLQLMYGLPNQDRDIIEDSNRRAAECEPEFVRLFPTVVLINSQLEKMYMENRYAPLTMEQALETLENSGRFFLSKGIAIAQIGLHPSGPLTTGHCLAAGPFHPRFGEMVRERIYQDDIIETGKGGNLGGKGESF